MTAHCAFFTFLLSLQSAPHAPSSSPPSSASSSSAFFPGRIFLSSPSFFLSLPRVFVLLSPSPSLSLSPAPTFLHSHTRHRIALPLSSSSSSSASSSRFLRTQTCTHARFHPPLRLASSSPPWSLLLRLLPPASSYVFFFSFLFLRLTIALSSSVFFSIFFLLRRPPTSSFSEPALLAILSFAFLLFLFLLFLELAPEPTLPCSPHLRTSRPRASAASLSPSSTPPRTIRCLFLFPHTFPSLAPLRSTGRTFLLRLLLPPSLPHIFFSTFLFLRRVRACLLPLLLRLLLLPLTRIAPPSPGLFPITSSPTGVVHCILLHTVASLLVARISPLSPSPAIAPDLAIAPSSSPAEPAEHAVAPSA